MAPPLLALRDIHLTFGGTPLLTGAELSVAAGDRICLVGRNGSGKSTLLKIAAGVIEPDKGERFMHPAARVRYLPQEVDLTGHSTVRSPMSRRDLGRRTITIAPARCCRIWVSPAMKTRRRSPAAKPGAQRLPAPWHRGPTFCCSTSRPITSISSPSNGSKPS